MLKKILIVDDDELTIQLLTSRLQEAGYAILSAATGEEALKLTIAEKPDVVIMDIMLPDQQGSDVVKSFDRYKEIPDDLNVIFLSGIISRFDETGEKLQIGGKDYPAIAKPINFNQLLSYLP